jgi:hypothetical protein
MFRTTSSASREGMTQSSMWDRLRAVGAGDVAVVGVSKHAGKTTLLNRLIDEAAHGGARLGIASVGVDGERLDAILGTPKPAVWAPVGTLVATAMSAQPADGAAIRWLMPADISSPLGDVWYGEVERAGAVVLAGVRQLAHLRACSEAFHRHSVEHVLFDGALARSIGVHPDVADVVVLATGAVLGDVDDVVQGTKDVLRRLQVPVLADSGLRAAVCPLFGRVGSGLAAAMVDRRATALEGGSGRLDCGSAPAVRTELANVRVSPSATGFGDDIRASLGITGDHNLVVCGGAVTSGLLDALAALDHEVLLLAHSPVSVVASVSSHRRFLRNGHRLCVSAAATVAAVAVNPVSPRGRLERTALLRAVAGAVDVPVWDALDVVSRPCS